MRRICPRKWTLDTHTVSSTLTTPYKKSGKAKLTVTSNQIAEKQDEIQQTEQRIADLEEHLQDCGSIPSQRMVRPVTRYQHIKVKRRQAYMAQAVC